MAEAWLTYVVPTVGRPWLARTLDSLDRQRTSLQGVQVLVVGDSHGGRTAHLEWAKTETLRRGPRYRWLEHDGGEHAWGQPQRQYGMQQAAGQWVAFTADDNVLTQEAVASIWLAVATLPHKMPLLFKVRTWQAGVIWQRKEVLHGNVDADCVVVPNEPALLGSWSNKYEGDFEFTSQTVEHYGGEVEWVDELISLARPGDSELWWR